MSTKMMCCAFIHKVGDISNVSVLPVFSRLQVTVPTIITEAASLDTQEIAVCLNRFGQNHQSRGWMGMLLCCLSGIFAVHLLLSHTV